jgi:peroxin-16
VRQHIVKQPGRSKKHLAFKWLVVLGIELTKALGRIYLVRNNRGKMLVSPVPAEVAAQQELKDMKLSAATVLANIEAKVPQHQHMDLIRLYAQHGRGGKNPHGRFWVMPTHPGELPEHVPSTLCIAAEVLHHLRPVIYVLARVLVRNDASWKPFFVSLLADVMSRMLWNELKTTKNATSDDADNKAEAKSTTRISLEHLGPNQQSELSRRMSSWAFYLLRSPFFDRFTIHPLVKICNFLSAIPLLGFFFSNALDFSLTLQSHYFYTSAS